MTLQQLDALTQPLDSFDARPVISLLVSLAAEQQASDLHLSPLPDKVELSLRVDGVLRHHVDLKPEVYRRVLHGLKNLAKLVSYKKSVPQDGSLTVDGTEIRVAVAPTVNGERVVLRILHHLSGPSELSTLGFSQQELEQMERLVDRPHGLILATGPAGSGKTTTLLSLMRYLVQKRRDRLRNDTSFRCSVVTLEDPVEYLVPGFHQTNIREAQGMTFAQGLRSILRQDPELILVGEIRDPETARAVVQAGLSGHLVFSTVHARDSVGVVPRMLELGVDPYQLSAALAGVIYQRLVRSLCPQCKQPERESSGPRGCSECQQSGFQGRVAVPEILVASELFREQTAQKAGLTTLRQQAISDGSTPLWEAAMLRVREGTTSLSEIERVIPKV